MGELYNIMAKLPQVQGRKAMDVLIKWAKKKFALEAPKVEKKEVEEEKKVEEVKDAETTEEKKDEVKKEDEKSEESKKDDEKKDEEKMDVDAKPEEEKKDEAKKDGEESKKEETKADEKKAEEKKEDTKDDIVEIIDEKETVVEEQVELDYVAKLEKFVKFITWDHTDAPYYLKEVRGKKVLSTEDQNEAMTKMLESFVANDGKSSFQSQQQAGKMQQEQIRPQSPAMRQMGPKSTQQQQRGRPVQKR